MIDMGVGIKTKGAKPPTGWEEVSPWLDFGMNIAWQAPTTAAIFDSENQNTAGILGFWSGTCFDCSGFLAPVVAEDNEGISLVLAVLAVTAFNLGYGGKSCASSVMTFKSTG